MYNQMMMFIQNTLCKVFRELGNPNKYKMWDFPIVNLFNWSILMGKVRWHVNEETWDILFIGMCGFFFYIIKERWKRNLGERYICSKVWSTWYEFGLSMDHDD